MINPIEHSRTKEAANKYKVEPYVISADVYTQKNLAGRGGWTWYTGSSSWMYEAGIKYLLGLHIENGYLSIQPCIPSDWKEYSIKYKHGNSVYNIHVSNPNGKNNTVESFKVPDTLKESCWSQENQLWYAHDGFGCSPHAIGRSVRCTCLSDGEMTRWNRDEFVGVLDEKFLPDWAKESLSQFQQEEAAESPGMNNQSM